MTKEEKAQLLLKKYLAQKASPAEIKQVESWYASYEHKPLSLSDDRKAEIGENVLGKLKQEMTQLKDYPRVVRFSSAFRLAKIAAAAILISGAGLLIWSVSMKNRIQEKLVSITTAAGETKTVKLADGSEILLSPLARLLYPAKFKENSRTIELVEGEAFFKIAHDEHRTFTVKTSNEIYTRVLGTSFRIQSYQSSRNIKISVATGKVAVGNLHQVFGTLVKGQQIVYDKNNQQASISYMPVPTYVNLVFEETSLKEVINKLQYVYNVSITISGTGLNKLRCNATFNTKQSLEEVLDVLCSLHHLKFKKSDDHKTFNVYKR